MSATVYTGGTFDLFHFGHARLLAACSRLGDVTVALNTDSFVERYKGRPPVVPFDARREVLLACKHVAGVIACDGDSRAAVEHVRPRYLAVGSDWARRDYYAQMGFDQDWLDERGIVLCYLPRTPGVSTSEIRERI